MWLKKFSLTFQLSSIQTRQHCQKKMLQQKDKPLTSGVETDNGMKMFAIGKMQLKFHQFKTRYIFGKYFETSVYMKPFRCFVFDKTSCQIVFPGSTWRCCYSFSRRSTQFSLEPYHNFRSKKLWKTVKQMVNTTSSLKTSFMDLKMTCIRSNLTQPAVSLKNESRTFLSRRSRWQLKKTAWLGC